MNPRMHRNSVCKWIPRIYFCLKGLKTIAVCDKCRLQTCRLALRLAKLSTLVNQTSTPVSQTSTLVRLFRLAISDGNGNTIYNLPVCKSAVYICRTPKQLKTNCRELSALNQNGPESGVLHMCPELSHFIPTFAFCARSCTLYLLTSLDQMIRVGKIVTFIPPQTCTHSQRLLRVRNELKRYL